MKFDNRKQAVKDAMLLYAVTDRAWVGARTLYEQVEECLKGGATIVQIREKGLNHEDFVAEAKEIVKLCHRYGVMCIINDDVQACLESGVSAHNVEEALLAQKRGADYLGVGAVHATGTKSEAKPLTWQDIKDICDSVTIPITAIGGVKLDNMLELRGTGVDGVAIVSGIFAAPNIEQATAQLLAQARKLVEA